MTRTRSCMLAAAAALALPAAASASTIAVTEFMNNAVGADGDRTWIELYNYGKQAVNLEGWSVRDNHGPGAFVFDDYTIASGDYLVLAKNKSWFESNWLFGQTDDRVIDGLSFELNNGYDGIEVFDSSGSIRWSLGFPNGSTSSGEATFLAVDDFSITYHGEPHYNNTDMDPGGRDAVGWINPEGIDGSGSLGYENTMSDPYMIGALSGDYGSPLTGGYSTFDVPEPASLVLLSLGALSMVRRRHA